MDTTKVPLYSLILVVPDEFITWNTRTQGDLTESGIKVIGEVVGGQVGVILFLMESESHDPTRGVV